MRRHRDRCLWLAAALLALSACSVGPQPTEPPASSEAPPPATDTSVTQRAAAYFHGELILPGPTKLDYSVALTPDEKSHGYIGTIALPAQNIDGAALKDVVFEPGKRIEFSLPVPGTATWRGTVDASGAIQCAFSQGSVEAECTMHSRSEAEHLASTEPTARPQTPVSPFPYDSRDVTYRNDAAGITLAGTLTVPKGPGPHPTALLITGSGAQDRDETIFGHKPFLVIADRLTRAGIAVLRVDDRGVGGTDAGPSGATTLDFAGDVQAGLAFLRTQPDIDAQRIGLIGHSEGGIIAPIVAAREPVAFAVLLAGTGVPGRDVLALQIKRGGLAEGASEDEATQAMKDQQAVVDIVVAETNPEQVRAQVRAYIAKRAKDDGAEAPTDAQLDARLRGITSPWFRQFLTLDPADHLTRVRCPVLVLNGELDVQVDAEQNVTAIEQALRKGGNKTVTVHRLPGLNHLFQRATTGAVSEYKKIEHTFDADALELLTRWVVDTTDED